MKKLMIGIFLTLVLINSSQAEDRKTLSVILTSECSINENGFIPGPFSGGTLFSRGDKAYVLTSFRAAMERRKPGSPECVNAWISREYVGDEKFVAKLFAKEWGLDLALFELDHFPESKIYSWPELTTEKIGRWTYRQEEDNQNSHRHFIPLLETVKLGRGEQYRYRDVGTLDFFINQTAKGMYSDQYLFFSPGSPSEIRSFISTFSEGVVLNPIIIPIDEISQWLKRVFDPEKPYRSMLDWTEEELTHSNPLIRTQKITSGGLEFRLDCGPVNTFEDSDSSSGSSLGPVGGANGVGVGGRDSRTGKCQASIKLDSSNGPWAYPERETLRQSILQTLKNEKAVIWDGFFRTNPITGDEERTGFNSFEQFFHLLKDSAQNPVRYPEISSRFEDLK